MSGWWLGGWTMVCLFVVVNSKVDIDSALRLAHCRATCLHKMHFRNLSDHSCRASYNCSQCWNVCVVLQKSRPACGEPYCIGGCHEACSWVSAGLPPPVLLTRPLEELTVTSSRVSWPPPAHASPTPVYVIMVDHQQFLQTLDLTAPLPLAVDPLTVQVLVVDWRGFTEVFTPRPQSPLEQARALVRHLGLEKAIGLNQRLSDRNRTLVPNTVLHKESELTPWRLRVASKIHQSDVVTAQISWDPQQSATVVQSQLMYLVTWQVEGGLVRGNLLTNTSSTTLSLSPDTIFRIQVALFTLDSSSRLSEFLVVNTHRPHLHLHNHRLLHPPGPIRTTQWEATIAASTAASLVAILFLAWRWKHRCSPPHYKLANKEAGTPKLYRVFSPMIRLTTESTNKRDTFSSTENLLQAISVHQFSRQ